MDQVDIDLLQSHLCPQAFLQTVCFPHRGSCTRAGVARDSPIVVGRNRAVPVIPSSVLGPYALAVGGTDAQATYLSNPRYFAATATPTEEIVQRRFPDAAAAAAALRRGEIQVLDRLSPWQVKSLAADADVVVQAYALPRVHCLIPNAATAADCQPHVPPRLGLWDQSPGRSWTSLLRGDRLPGCDGPSRPVSRRQLGRRTPSATPPIPRSKPWPYDPRLAVALAEAGRREVAASGQGRTAVPSPPPVLVLAFPPGEIARTACDGDPAAVGRHRHRGRVEGASRDPARPDARGCRSALRGTGPLGTVGRRRPRAGRGRLGRRVQLADEPGAAANSNRRRIGTRPSPGCTASTASPTTRSRVVPLWQLTDTSPIARTWKASSRRR